jgi:hypothetical protein
MRQYAIIDQNQYRFLIRFFNLAFNPQFSAQFAMRICQNLLPHPLPSNKPTIFTFTPLGWTIFSNASIPN